MRLDQGDVASANTAEHQSELLRDGRRQDASQRPFLEEVPQIDARWPAVFDLQHAGHSPVWSRRQPEATWVAAVFHPGAHVGHPTIIASECPVIWPDVTDDVRGQALLLLDFEAAAGDLGTLSVILYTDNSPAVTSQLGDGTPPSSVLEYDDGSSMLFWAPAQAFVKPTQGRCGWYLCAIDEPSLLDAISSLVELR